jgi:uncharacterized protein YukE
MSQIKADTDALRATIAAMRQGSSTIENALQQAAQAMTTLQNSRWSGNHRQQAEEVWTRLQAQFAPTIEALNQIAARTERFTNALEEAGRVFGDGGIVTAKVDKSGNQVVFEPQTTVTPSNSPNKKEAWVTQAKEGVDHVSNVADILSGFTKFAHFMRSDKGSIGRLLQLAPGPIPQIADQFGDGLQAISQGLHIGPHGPLVKLLKSKGFGWGLAGTGTALALLEKYQEGQLTWQVVGAETTKTGVAMVIGSTGWGSVILGANAGVQLTGTLVNSGTEALAKWVAGPEYDGQIAENARRMNDALKKADLMSPINNTIDVLWQGQFDKALPTFWESTVDIGKGYAEYFDAAGDQLAIIGTAVSEKLAPVIDQTIQGVKDTGAAVVRQVQEQTKQFFDSIINSSGLGGLFRFR